jgi:metal-responsive CopG/Arc/MetJ family transcriptional regulator
MTRAVKIAISLPEDLLRVVDEQRLANGTSRSAFFRLAVEELSRRQREQDAAGRYVRGYLQHPESDEEIQEALQTATAVLAVEPWV